MTLRNPTQRPGRKKVRCRVDCVVVCALKRSAAVLSFWSPGSLAAGCELSPEDTAHHVEAQDGAEDQPKEATQAPEAQALMGTRLKQDALVHAGNANTAQKAALSTSRTVFTSFWVPYPHLLVLRV